MAAEEKWYFTKEQLANTPSRRCGTEADKELSNRQQAANFIQDMGQRLQVTQLCINTAIVYMHRFYVYHSFTHFHRNAIATAALFLAAKVEEQPRKLEHVIKVAHVCLQRQPQTLDTKSDSYLEQAQDLVFNENVLLQTLSFDVAIDHPHTHVVRCCHMVKASKDLAQTSYFMASNSLHLTTMCLQYKPTVVACFCIHLACKWSNWEIPQSNEGKDWFSYVDASVTFEQLETLTTEFLAIFDKCPTKLKRKIMSITATQNAIMPSQTSQGSQLFDNEPRKIAESAQSRHLMLPAAEDAGTAGAGSRKSSSSAGAGVPSASKVVRQSFDQYKEKRDKERLEREHKMAVPGAAAPSAGTSASVPTKDHQNRDGHHHKPHPSKPHSSTAPPSSAPTPPPAKMAPPAYHPRPVPAAPATTAAAANSAPRRDQPAPKPPSFSIFSPPPAEDPAPAPAPAPVKHNHAAGNDLDANRHHSDKHSSLVKDSRHADASKRPHAKDHRSADGARPPPLSAEETQRMFGAKPNHKEAAAEKRTEPPERHDALKRPAFGQPGQLAPSPHLKPLRTPSPVKAAAAASLSASSHHPAKPHHRPGPGSSRPPGSGHPPGQPGNHARTTPQPNARPAQRPTPTPPPLGSQHRPANAERPPPPSLGKAPSEKLAPGLNKSASRPASNASHLAPSLTHSVPNLTHSVPNLTHSAPNLTHSAVNPVHPAGNAGWAAPGAGLLPRLKSPSRTGSAKKPGPRVPPLGAPSGAAHHAREARNGGAHPAERDVDPIGEFVDVVNVTPTKVRPAPPTPGSGQSSGSSHRSSSSKPGGRHATPSTAPVGARRPVEFAPVPLAPMSPDLSSPVNNLPLTPGAGPANNGKNRNRTTSSSSEPELIPYLMKIEEIAGYENVLDSQEGFKLSDKNRLSESMRPLRPKEEPKLLSPIRSRTRPEPELLSPIRSRVKPEPELLSPIRSRVKEEPASPAKPSRPRDDLPSPLKAARVKDEPVKRIKEEPFVRTHLSNSLARPPEPFRALPPHAELSADPTPPPAAAAVEPEMANGGPRPDAFIDVVNDSEPDFIKTLIEPSRLVAMPAPLEPPGGKPEHRHKSEKKKKKEKHKHKERDKDKPSREERKKEKKKHKEKTKEREAAAAAVVSTAPATPGIKITIPKEKILATTMEASPTGIKLKITKDRLKESGSPYAGSPVSTPVAGGGLKLKISKDIIDTYTSPMATKESRKRLSSRPAEDARPAKAPRVDARKPVAVAAVAAAPKQNGALRPPHLKMEAAAAAAASGLPAAKRPPP